MNLSRLLCRTAVVLAATAFVTLAHAATAEITGLRAQHPRLIATADTWPQVLERSKHDPLLAAVVQRIEADAQALLPQPPSKYHKIGRRLLNVSREVERRTLVLAAAYRLTGNPAYLRRAEAELLAVADFADWNPSHFLDVGEMTAASALGYDWLYADLSPATRTKIRDAIIAKGLQQGLKTRASFNGWQHTENNWNQVCFGGLVLGALAVGDEQPEIASQMLATARAGMKYGLKAYAPDGVYPEGPGYWSYGTSYSVLTFAALETALQTDWGYKQSPGFLASAGAYLECVGPTGLAFNYSDGGEKTSIQPALFWFAREAHDDGLLATQVAILRHAAQTRDGLGGEASRLLPLMAVWWPTAAVPAAPALPLAWSGHGNNPLAIFRSSWSDPAALYLALKGGSPSLNHAHMDAGSFVFDLDGVRWAHDLGSQEYESLESKGVDLWNKTQQSQRWQVFRLNNHSHNTLTLGGELQRVAGKAAITRFSEATANRIAVVDVSSIYAGQAERVMRGFHLQSDNRGVLIQDEIAGAKAGTDICWNMVTAAKAQVSSDGHTATLRENGHTLTVRVLAPTNAKFTVITAAPPADGFNVANPGRWMLQAHAPAPADGTTRVAVLLDADANARADVAPIASW